MPTRKAVRFEHRGGNAFHAEPSSGHPLDFDDREANTGGSPVETVLSALGACSAMDIVVDPREEAPGGRRRTRSRWSAASATSTRRSTPRSPSPRARRHGSSVAAVRRAIELSATKYCPVNAMVSAGPTVVHHRYRIRSGGSTPHEAEDEVLVDRPVPPGGRDPGGRQEGLLSRSDLSYYQVAQPDLTGVHSCRPPSPQAPQPRCHPRE